MIDYFDPVVQTHTVAGKLLHVSARISDLDILESAGDHGRSLIRHQLATQLVHYMLDNNLMEFTQQTDISTGHLVVNARCHITPNGETKLIRTLTK